MFGDVLGFGKASEKLLDLIGKACGTVYRPTAIRKEAAAKAEEIRLLGAAAAEAEANTIRIVGLADAEQRLLASGTDIEILDRAKARLVAREVQRQSNIENIVQIALQELPEEVSEDPVKDNWRVRFFNLAEDIADSDMQALWGKILAGEVARPGRYSLRTLEIVRNLSAREAELFQCACGLAFNGGWIAKLESLDGPFADLRDASADFSEFGLPYKAIFALGAAGLISPLHDLSWDFGDPQIGEDGRQIFSSENNGIPAIFRAPPAQHLYVPAVVFTPAGTELMTLIPPALNIEYLRRVAAGLRKRAVPISFYRPRIVDGVICPEQFDDF